MAKTHRKATRRKKPATAKPDPLAKVSSPNLRRMVKRLQADERRLAFVCQSRHERYLQTLARVMQLEDRIANLRQDLGNHIGVAESLVEKNDALAARVRELERRLAATEPDPNDHPHPCGPLDIIATVKVQAQPDPLAGCVVVEGGRNPYPLEAIGRSSVVDDGCVDFVWSMTVPMQSDSPTHPAPCRETGTLRPIIVGSWWHRRRSTDLTTSPLPGDASCLLGEDGVSIRNGVYKWIMPYLNTWMIGDFDEYGNDNYPEFTIPRSTTWTP